MRKASFIKGSEMPTQQALPLNYHVDYRREHFYVSPSNETAFAWIDRWPQWEGQHRLALYGDTGCGKTHLAHIWEQRTHALWLTSAMIDSTTPDVIAQQAPAFVLDLPAVDETWLFHFYNLCQERQAFWLACHRVAPSQWPTQLPDLRSRLATLLAIEVKRPDESALKELLLKLFRERGVIITDAIAQYLLNRADRSFVHLKSLVEAIDAYALKQKRSISVPLIRAYLEEQVGE
jgi:chromosomal replication initiation ATPase DnaA